MKKRLRKKLHKAEFKYYEADRITGKMRYLTRQETAILDAVLLRLSKPPKAFIIPDSVTIPIWNSYK